MAEKKVIEIQVNTGDAEKNVNNLTNDITQVSGIIKSLLVLTTNSLIVLFLAIALLFYQPNTTILISVFLLIVYFKICFKGC